MFQSYFEDNPRDLQLLRHDKTLHTVRQQPELRHVPDYLGKLCTIDQVFSLIENMDFSNKNDFLLKI